MPRPRGLLVAVVLFSVAASAQTPRAPITKATVAAWMTELSNWGRWGSADQLGTVNLITASKRKAAAALVTGGAVVSLSRPLNPLAAVDNPSPFVDKMSAEPAGGMFNMDEFALPVHGFAFSHLDALSHVIYEGKMYNGVPQSSLTGAGASRHNVDVYGQGIVSRGVLIDIPWLKGLPYLEPGVAIYPADLDAWERRTGIKVGSGDIVLVRTGRWAYRAARGPWDIGAKAAGVDASAAPWFKRRDIAVFGSDGAGDVIPSGIDGMEFPLHPLFLVAMGTPMLDQLNLEDVAATASASKRWTFLVTVAPLRATGATGSPVNALAVF